MTVFAGSVTVILGLVMMTFFGFRIGVKGTPSDKFADVCLALAGCCALFTGLTMALQ